MLEILGWMGMVLIGGAMMPQLVKTIKTKAIENLSIWTYIAYLVGCVIWLIYAILLNSPSLISLELVCIFQAGTIAYLILRERRN